MTFDTPELTRHRVRLAQTLSFVGFAGMTAGMVLAAGVRYLQPHSFAFAAAIPYLLSVVFAVQATGGGHD